MITLTKIHARQILDSRGNPTVEAEVHTTEGVGMASVPSGASTGIHEAVELRDGKKAYAGLGVQKAIINIEKRIFPLLKGKMLDQRKLDELMIREDNTENKSSLGANAMLAVSLAFARAVAGKNPLYRYLHAFYKTHYTMPVPYMNVINGGKHAGDALAIQEFMIVPQFSSFSKNLQAGSEVYHLLKKIIGKKYGKMATNVGDEGGFAPPLKTTEQALTILLQAIKEAGYAGKIKLAVDCAASEFYQKNKYHLDGKHFSARELLNYYLHLIRKYPLISLEDPFAQEDFASFHALHERTKIQIVGDDITVTSIPRLQEAIRDKSITCLLLKLNQIGTLTEAVEAGKLAQYHHLKVMVSHRSGETEDTFISDLAVALGCGMIKSGAPCRGERTAKYNRLLRIQEELHR